MVAVGPDGIDIYEVLYNDTGVSLVANINITHFPNLTQINILKIKKHFDRKVYSSNY
jgi:hypothetical protein